MKEEETGYCANIVDEGNYCESGRSVADFVMNNGEWTDRYENLTEIDRLFFNRTEICENDETKGRRITLVNNRLGTIINEIYEK